MLQWPMHQVASRRTAHRALAGRTDVWRQLLLALLALVGACGRNDGVIAERPGAIVHDTDDRTDVFAHPDDQLRTLAHDSVLALMPSAVMTEEVDGTWTVNALSLGTRFGLCDDGTQRFLSQPSAASCSATLVAPDVVLTAGHCVQDAASCEDSYFVFDYLYARDGALEIIDATDVYRCDRILTREDSVAGDFAFIRLDREAVGRTPVTIARAPHDAPYPIATGDSLSTLGFPSGLPLKIDDGGRVVNAPDTDAFFSTSLDTFAGSSGSGVFDASRQLVGVFSTGRSDYEFASGEDCQVVRVTAEVEGRERVGHVLDALRQHCALDDETALCAPLEPLPDPSGCAVTKRAQGLTTDGLWIVVAILGVSFRQRVLRNHRS